MKKLRKTMTKTDKKKENEFIKKEFNFAISHRLENHKGLCNNVHGHNYKLFVTVKRTDNKLITKKAQMLI